MVGYSLPGLKRLSTLMTLSGTLGFPQFSGYSVSVGHRFDLDWAPVAQR